eukprot:13548508-Ditylum_brightwellii.AAC.1
MGGGFNPGQGWPGGHGNFGQGMLGRGAPPVMPLDSMVNTVTNLEGTNNMDTLASLQSSQVKSIAENLPKVPATLGGIYIRTMAT